MSGQAFYQLIETRHSVRTFSSDPVDERTLKRLLQAAVRAPSAHNRQPWRFAVIRSEDTRTRLARAMAGRFRTDLIADGLPQLEVESVVERAEARMASAPAVIILCMTMQEMDEYPDDRRRSAERVMAVQSVALAGGHLLLAAHAEGLGGCWICGPLFAPDVVRQELQLPDGWEPQAAILLGRFERPPRRTDRRPPEEITQWL